MDVHQDVYGARAERGHDSAGRVRRSFVLLAWQSVTVELARPIATFVSLPSVSGNVQSDKVWSGKRCGGHRGHPRRVASLGLRARSCFVCCMFHTEADVTWRLAELSILGLSFVHSRSLFNLVVQAPEDGEWLSHDRRRRMIDVFIVASPHYTG